MIEKLPNKHPRWINLLCIKILGFEFNINIGNPLWFIKEFKDIYEDDRYRRKVNKYVSVMKTVNKLNQNEFEDK